MYNIKVNIEKLRDILKRGKLVNIAGKNDISFSKLNSGEEILKIALNIKESVLSFNSQEGIFTFPFVGTVTEAESYFCRNLSEFIKNNVTKKQVLGIIETINRT